MGDSDAEWVGVDFEFGKRPTTTTTRRPRQPRPTFTEKPVLVPPHDAPEKEGPPGNSVSGSVSMTVIPSVVGGIFCVVLVILLVYMLVLRRRLNKAKVETTDSQYQLRVEDVAHITNLDETSNTYVNTTDLQKLLSTVKAKTKSQEKPPPTLPKVVHQTPTPYRSVSNNKSSAVQGSTDNKGYASDPDVVVLRAPMPLPHDTNGNESFRVESNCTSWSSTESEAVYSNVNETEPFKQSKTPSNTRHSPDTEALYCNVNQNKPFKLSKPPFRRKVEAPVAAPPPPPTKQGNVSDAHNNLRNSEPTSPTAIARPAPPPPALKKTKSSEALDSPNSNIPQQSGNSKPIPPVAPKPNKSGSLTDTKPAEPLPIPVLPSSSKPALPVSSKPTPPVLRKQTTPVANKPTPLTNNPIPPATSKPIFPPASKPVPPAVNKPTPTIPKPAPPTASKPGVAQKGKGLPPLKMALIPTLKKKSTDSCATTPDTGIIELTPENTPTPDTGSISSKIAFLEGKMKTPILPTRAMP